MRRHRGKRSPTIHRCLPDFFNWILVVDTQLHIDRFITEVVVFGGERGFCSLFFAPQNENGVAYKICRDNLSTAISGRFAFVD
jgi:hypothetical protein